MRPREWRVSLPVARPGVGAVARLRSAPVAYPLEGKRILVTGGSSGIGAALACGFAERGAVVGICARRKERLEDVLAKCQVTSPESRLWVVDLADLDGVAPFAARVEEELGRVDVLVNNAGIPKRRHVTALTADVVEAVMAINYFSPVRLTMALLPGMLARGEGRIINISSVAARLSPPGESAYAASKAALTEWSSSMAVDLWETGVRVHVVNPGIIDTELFSLPDNDPLVAEIEALPPSAVTEAVLGQLDGDIFEVYVPAWFGDLAAGKARDVGAFLRGSATWLRQQRQPS
jgi:NAD(P)-dependent dehydrogenase (short-subunit alcohol dehydrogenase family)